MMHRLLLTFVVIGLLQSSPTDAALNAPDIYTGNVAGWLVNDEHDPPAALCVPPDLQYIPDCIRAVDGTIVGINYRIVEYVC